jgi:hypothetical protein
MLKSITKGVACVAFLLCVSLLPAHGKDQYLFDVIKSPAYRQAWQAMLGGARNLPSWLGQITGKGDYVASPSTTATIGGADYSLFHACKAHDCAGNEFGVMFTASGTRAFGMLIDAGGPPRWFGTPDAAQQAALAKAMKE